MAFEMSRNLIVNSFRLSGNLWVAADQTTFNVNQRSDGTLLVAERQLSIGDVISKQTAPGTQFLVSQCTYLTNYEAYTLLRITHTADTQRFSAEGSRDSFGRISTDTPATVYSAVPLHLFPQDRSRPDSKPDRSDEATLYRFATSGSYTLAVKDRLSIAGTTLVVNAVLLSPAGLTEILATETA